MKTVECVILDDYQNVATSFANWKTLGEKINLIVYNEHFEEETELIQKIGNAEIIVVMRERTPLTRSLLQKLPNLKLIVTSGMRNSSIDMKYASEKQILVCGTASSSEPPLELTWALLLSLARSIQVESQNLREGNAWQSTVGIDLNGKTMGLLGLGKIGSKMALIARAFGMNVIAWSQNLTAEAASKHGAILASSKEELLRSSDIVSIHLVLSERTRHLIKANDLRMMKNSSLLINTSRAAIIDEKALIEALNQTWIKGAAVDVFDLEPLPPEHPLRTQKNLLATPHLGYVSENNYRVYFQEAIEDIESYLNGAPIRKLN
jgi:phosphoglycerate dehydrogenase-like enzyme